MTTEGGAGAPLLGRVVAITADRRRGDQVRLLESRGASVLEVPTLKTVPNRLPDEVLAATRALLEAPPDVTVVTTGGGLRSWLARAAEAGLDQALVAALGRGCVVARGAKAASAAASAGLEVSWRAPHERFDEVIDHVLGLGVDGALVAVQRFGRPVDHERLQLEAAGADVVEVAPYDWDMPDDVEAVRGLIRAVVAGAVDAVTFTSVPAVENLFVVAEEDGSASALVDAFARGVVAVCVGPVCAGAARQEGLAGVVCPERPRLVPMIDALTRVLTGAEVA